MLEKREERGRRGCGIGGHPALVKPESLGRVIGPQAFWPLGWQEPELTTPFPKASKQQL